MAEGTDRASERNRQLLGYLRYAQTESDAASAGAHNAPAPAERSPNGVLAAIDGLGFEPRDVTPDEVRRSGGLTIELAYCPYAAAVEAPGGDLVCAYHRGMVAEIVRSSGGTLAGVDVHPPADGRCRVRIEDLPGGPAR